MTTTRQVVAGHNTRFAMAAEDDFASLPDAPDWFVPGYDTSITQKEGSHQATKLFATNSREATEIIEEMFDGTLNVEFVLSGPEFIEFVIAAGDGGSPETFEGDFPTSGVAVIGNEVRDNEDVLTGLVCSDFEVSCDVPGEFEVSLDFAYANAETDRAGVGTSGPADQPSPSGEPMTFTEASYKVGDTEIELVSNASLSVSNNPDLVGDFGTNVAVDYSPKEREVDSSYSKVDKASPAVDEREALYGGADSVGGNDAREDGLVFEASDGTRTITFETGPSILDSLSEDNLGDPENDVELSPDRTARRDGDTPAIRATAEGF